MKSNGNSGMHTKIEPGMRLPSQVMRLERLGSMHQCRLSFMRILTRRMARENWQFSRPVFQVNERGVGHAVYTAKTPDRTYSLVAFCHDLPAEMRSDRVIATAWDATFTLFDGVPDDADITRLGKNIPFQEAGRVTQREISVSRANRSVRLWETFVAALAAGRQPDAALAAQVGYLMRTTAVYGSGKLGAADRETLQERDEMRAPFQVEMLSVFLTRSFVRDLVNHMARARGGEDAVELDSAIATGLGIGNSTGLGLAPYLINHPVLFNNWIMAREQAIRRVRGVAQASPAESAQFLDVVARSKITLAHWHSEHPIQIKKLGALRRDFARLERHLSKADLQQDAPWHRLMDWAEDALASEGQELLASLIMEPYGDLVDDLADVMHDANPAAFYIDGAMPVGDVCALLRASFGWARRINWDEPKNCARAWYISEEKLEPRLGERFEEPIAEYEQPLAPARDAMAALADMEKYPQDQQVAHFLLQHPEHRHSIRRGQISARAPYGEIHDNTISAHMLPIDMLRAKLAFFGATRFDPRSDRWVRINMFAGAPYPETLTKANADKWVYPEVPS